MGASSSAKVDMAQTYFPIAGIVAIAIALPALGKGESRESVTREDVFKAVQSLADDKDLFAASEYVLGLENESKIVEAFSNLVLDCHHKVKSTEQILHFGYAGVHYCLGRAALYDENDRAAAKKLRFAAKRMATNVASFTWPGWDEPGVTISREQMRAGLAFAQYSVRQLHELDPNTGQLAFTYWFLGAQLIAHEQYDEAIKVLEEARDYSREQGDGPEGVKMLEGYIGLTRILKGQKEAGESAFSSAMTALKTRDNEDARFYAKQLVTARAVFEGKSKPIGAVNRAQH